MLLIKWAAFFYVQKKTDKKRSKNYLKTYKHYPRFLAYLFIIKGFLPQ